MRVWLVYNKHLQEQISIGSLYTVTLHALLLHVYHSWKDCRREKEITNCLLKDEGEGGERERESRVHTCLVADPGHDLALHAIYTN